MVDQRTASQENIVRENTGKVRSKSYYFKWGIFGVIALLALSALITAIVIYELRKNEVSFRVDCLPEEDIDYKVCMDRGCEWRSSNVKDQPACFFPDGSGYKNIEEHFSNNSYKAVLRWTDKVKPFYGQVTKEVSAAVYYETERRVRFQIKDPKTKRYEVPLELPTPSPTIEPKDYAIETTNDPQFGLRIKRNSTNTVIFDTNTPGTIFSDQFHQITIKLPSPYVFGLGEHRTVTYLQDMNWRKWNLFSRDMGPFENPEDGYNNLYGVHPFYMNIENDGKAHGVFFLNSNAMEITLQPHPAITFRSIGGIMDFYIFLGPTPEDVVKQYLQVVGLPMMPTYWSLGFHLCRYGYKNLDEVRAVVKRTTEAGIPLDVQYLDIDYMLNKRDFTYNEEEFNGLPDFVKYLNEKKNIKVGIILDPAIASNSTLLGKYKPLDLGLEMDVFVKDKNGSVLEGEVWPGLTYYPDFSHENASRYWTQLCREFREKVHYDSMWIDMNEPSSFVEGSVKGCEKNKWNYPPFAAGVLGSKNGNKLFEKTICMDAIQKAGMHYNVHNLYGHFQAEVTYSALKAIYNGTRPVIVGRSTYSGTGKYAGHWLGDNRSWWSNLRDSIPGMMKFSLFGIPYIGADICGFFDNTTEQMCARWSQLGAFYPFSRNHNAEGFISQDPAAMGELVIRAAREALKTRYRLLPYLYTLFHYAHTDGSTVVRPLLHEFPNDRETYKISFQFLWGAALLISPVVTESVDTIACYFPAGIWYDFYTGKAYVFEAGKHVNLNASWEKVNLHVREGWIIPLQKPDLNTALSRKYPMQLFVAPDKNGFAQGSLFWDDGEMLDTDLQKLYLMLNFRLHQKNETTKVLVIKITENGYDGSSDLYFDSITLCRQETEPTKVEHKRNKVVWEYKEEMQVVYLHSLRLSIMENAEIVLTFH